MDCRPELQRLEQTPPWEWPTDASDLLLEVLRDEQAAPAERVLAAELASDTVVVNDAIVAALLSILKDADASDELRGAAAIALGPALEEADTFGFDDEEDVPISELTFRRIQDLLRRLYFDAKVPKTVRRRVLEASVRAPQKWHRDAVRAAYASGDDEWLLTAVFCMEYIRGFDEQILDALGSDDEEVHCAAVAAAGNWEVEAAWDHIAALAAATGTEKALRVAAITAVASIRPRAAAGLLVPLMDSDDEEIAQAAHEAVGMARAQIGAESGEDLDEDFDLDDLEDEDLEDEDLEDEDLDDENLDDENLDDEDLTSEYGDLADKAAASYDKNDDDDVDGPDAGPDADKKPRR